MLDQLALYSDELTELLLGELPVPEALIRKTIRERHAGEHDRAGAVRLGLGRHRRAAGVGRRGRLSSQPRRRAAGRRARPEEEKDVKLSRKPDAAEPFCGLVFKIQADRHGDLHYVRVYSGRAQGQQPRLQSRQGQEGKCPATLAHPGRRPQAGRRGRGGRHHRRHRPAPQRHRRHALRPPRADPAGVDHLPRYGHLRWPSSRNRPPSGRSWPTCWK